MRTDLTRPLILALALPALCTTASANVPSYRVVATSGDPAPGITGQVFGTFSKPQMNNAGIVAFGAATDGFLSGGAFLDDPVGGLSLLIKRGGSLANNSSVQFWGLGDDFTLNESGLIGAGCIVRVGNSNRDGIVILNSAMGNVVQAYEDEQITLDDGPHEFDRLRFGSMNESGELCFHAQFDSFTPNDQDETIWRATPTGRTLVARETDVTPLAPGRYLSHEEPTLINDNGTVVFTGTLAGDFAFSQLRALMREPTGGPQTPVALEDDPAPGFEPGHRYGPSDRYRNFVLNNLDRVAFSGTRAQSGLDAALWSEGAGMGTQLVIRSNQPAPGLPAGTVFQERLGTGNGTEIAMNDAGALVCRWRVAGPGIDELNDDCLWYHDNGITTPIVREGDPAPGTPSGTVFNGNTARYAINPDGILVFLASLRGGDTGLVNRNSLWTYDPSTQGVTLIVRAGDVIDVNPDPFVNDVRIVERVDLGTKQAVTDDGTIVVLIEYTNGDEGILVFDLEGPARIFVSDFDADGNVDLTDFGTFGAAFGSSLGDPSYNPAADFDSDGDIDLTDFGTFGSEFGNQSFMP